MAHDTPTIIAETRERVGTRYSHGCVKAATSGRHLWAQDRSSRHQYQRSETISHIRHGAHVMNLEIEGVGTETCLVKDLQFGFMGDDVIHVDFTRVNLDETVTVNVSLNMHGTLSGAVVPGAIVVTDLSEIEVSCAVRNIPEAIRIDLGSFEESVTIGDIDIPENVTPLLGLETTIAHIVFQAEEEEETTTETVEGEDPQADAPSSESSEQDGSGSPGPKD